MAPVSVPNCGAATGKKRTRPPGTSGLVRDRIWELYALKQTGWCGVSFRATGAGAPSLP